jgi:rare lipoprotein A
VAFLPHIMNYLFAFGLCTLLLCNAGSCPAQLGFTQTGLASYYAGRFSGRPTASGETFNSQEFTAAHPTLAFNTMLRVTNAANGRSVLVRVNDRGPFAGERVLDVSRAAARELGMLGTGTATITLVVVGADGQEVPGESDHKTGRIPVVPAHTYPDTGEKFRPGKTYSTWGTEKFARGFGIQVASHTDLLNARDICKELIAGGITEVYIQVELVAGEKVYRVLAGAFARAPEAAGLLGELRAKEFDGFIKTHFQ